MSMLEAARWAPSSNNAQPWRFAIVLRNDPQWDALFATLNPNNQTWAGKAGALVAIASYQFNKEAGAQVLGLPADHTLQMLATVGKRGDAAMLPDALREREAPNPRKPLSALAKRGSF